MPRQLISKCNFGMADQTHLKCNRGLTVAGIVGTVRNAERFARRWGKTVLVVFHIGVGFHNPRRAKHGEASSTLDSPVPTVGGAKDAFQFPINSAGELKGVHALEDPVRTASTGPGALSRSLARAPAVSVAGRRPGAASIRLESSRSAWSRAGTDSGIAATPDCRAHSWPPTPRAYRIANTRRSCAHAFSSSVQYAHCRSSGTAVPRVNWFFRRRANSGASDS